MKKCNRHRWVNIKIKQIYEVDVDPAGVNLYFPSMVAEICVACHKMRSPRVGQEKHKKEE